MGDNIMIVGLSFQVFTLFVFTVMGIDFGFNIWYRVHNFGPETTLDQSPEKVKVRSSRMLRGFIPALAISTLLIFWRSVYRAIELSGGWTGYMMYDQSMFVWFEGVIILLAVYALNFFHPALVFGDLINLGKAGKTVDLKLSTGSQQQAK
jgi:hypothetical protein